MACQPLGHTSQMENQTFFRQEKGENTRQPKRAQLVVVDHSQQTLDQETHVTPALSRCRRGYLLQLGGQRLNLFLVRLLSLVGLTSEG